MSGLVSLSHSSRRGRRPLTPLTLNVAIFMCDGHSRQACDAYAGACTVAQLEHGSDPLPPNGSGCR